MATSAQTATGRDPEGPTARWKPNRQPIRILFVHRNLEAVERCLRELHSVQFLVNRDVAENADTLAKCVGPQRYDLIVAESPGTDPQWVQTIKLLRQTKNGTPVI